MTQGKNKLVRYMRMYVNGGDLSGDSRNFSEGMDMTERVDMTGWQSSALRSYLNDPAANVGITGYQAMMNDAANQAFAQLKDAGLTGYEISMIFGGGGAPSAGDPAYVMAASSLDSVVSIDDRKLILTADFLPDPNIDIHYTPYGRILLPRSAVTGGVTGATVDDVAAKTVGYHAYLHILVAGGTFVFKVQHSINGSAWSDLVTFSANGSAITSERAAAAAATNQYWRALVTQSSPGACEAVITFAAQ